MLRRFLGRDLAIGSYARLWLDLEVTLHVL